MTSRMQLLTTQLVERLSAEPLDGSQGQAVRVIGRRLALVAELAIELQGLAEDEDCPTAAAAFWDALRSLAQAEAAFEKGRIAR